MKTQLFLWTCVAAFASGCATQPQEGATQQVYYQAYKRQDAAVVRRVEPAPAPSVLGPMGVSGTVYFGFDQSTLQPQYLRIVEQHGEYLRQHTGRKVQLDGHTDERGGTEYNIGLGQRRAETVRQALMRMGVADSQLEAVSFGKEKPASQLQTEEGHQLNRRVEFSYR